MQPALRANPPRPVIELTEWAEVDHRQNRLLQGVSFEQDQEACAFADELDRRKRIHISREHRGLKIATTSFVGRVNVGPLSIAIRPKLPNLPLAVLLRYAYNLKQLDTSTKTDTPTAQHGLHDLLVALLAAEAESIVRQGLARRYLQVADRLESVRGKIDINRLARQGGVRDARIPCLYFERDLNWELNRILHAGLELSAGMTDDRALRRRVHRLAEAFGAPGHGLVLHADSIAKAERSITRLTSIYLPALELIRLLHGMRGVGFDSSSESALTDGFLFDMNPFFQRLLSRFLNDNLPAMRVVDEWTLRDLFAFAPQGNPQRRKIPSPRPDYALFRGPQLHALLDAKYRDIWDRSLPPEWLYQLSMYAIAAPTQTSILLYGSMCAEARDQHIVVQQPSAGRTDPLASVILRPVLLTRLAGLLDPDNYGSCTQARRQWADELVCLTAG